MTRVSKSAPQRQSALKRSLREAQALVKLGLPIIVGHFAVVGMSLTDTIMAGQAGASDLAGLAVSVNLWIPVSICLIGILTALVPITAQYRGANDQNAIAEVLNQGSWLGLICGLLVAVLLNLALPWVTLLEADPQVTSVAQSYLQAIAWGLPPLALNIALQSWLEGLGRVKPIMVINLILLALNIPLDYALVQGKWGLPALGGAGCGWATAVLCWLALGGTLIYLFWLGRRLGPYRRRLLHRPRWQPQKHILLLGTPLGLAMMAEEGFISVMVLLAAPLGAEAISGLQVSASYLMLIVVIAVGLGQAITIRTALALGAGNPAAARFCSQQGLLWNLIIMSIASLAALIASDHIITLFSDDESIRAVALGMMWLSPLVILLDCLLQSINGTLRAHKDTKVPLLLLVLSYWGIALPLSYGLIHLPFNGEPLGITGCYLGYIIGFGCGAVLLAVRLRQLSKKPPGANSSQAMEAL